MLIYDRGSNLNFILGLFSKQSVSAEWKPDLFNSLPFLQVVMVTPSLVFAVALTILALVFLRVLYALKKFQLKYLTLRQEFQHEEQLFEVLI